MIEKLLEQGVNADLLEEVRAFRMQYPITDEESLRAKAPPFLYYGKEVWEKAITAILAGENLLLAGPKATGKNILADGLSHLFFRPRWNISMHIHTDAQTLIGGDTFVDGKVRFRPGPITLVARHGGFGILDEINMARNDAVAVLHATLDYRRIIDISGYGRIVLEPQARFIATMNYGYIGTKELNEALASRFMVIQVPEISQDGLHHLLSDTYPGLTEKAREQFVLLFEELQKKSRFGEISSKPVDLRGLLSALHLIRRGLLPRHALEMGIVHKTFDRFEQDLVRDILLLRFPDTVKASDLFERE